MKLLLLISISFFLLGDTNAQVTNGLVADYSFNNGDAKDDAGTNDGFVFGATLTADRFGNANSAYSFNGTSSINCGNSIEIQSLVTSFSVSAWFKRSSFSSSFEVIAAKWDNYIASEHFFLATTSNFHFAWATAGSDANAGVADPTVLSVDTWHHVVMTWNTDGTHKIYLDGILTTISILTPHVMDITTPVDFFIGAQSTSYRNFNGQIDDVKVFNRDISSTEVTDLFTAENPLTASISENKNSTFSIFPNPATTELSISVKQATTISIVNIVGEEIIRSTIQSKELINLFPFDAGIYFVKDLTSGLTIKFIKK